MPLPPPDPLVLYGRLVTLDEDNPLIEDGALYVGADQRIHAAQQRTGPPPAGFEQARRIQTGGSIYPGLMDLHNHVVYNTLPLWHARDQREPFTTRYQWSDDSSYKPLVGNPANALGALAGKAHLKYVETKAVIGGVTAIQGSAKTGRPYEGWLVRNVEYETFMTGDKTVFQSALPLRPAEFEARRRQLDGGGAFIYHLSEGTDARLVGEYEELREERLVRARLCGIHCTALTEPVYAEWKQLARPDAGSVIWSPFSNLWLYNGTTDVVSARAAGMRICLGADWSPSGCKNLLGELKVADLWNRTELGGAFSPEEFVAMTTLNPADALGWTARLGRLRPGLHGDVVVVADVHDDPYRNLIEAREADVHFVAINGYPFYGTAGLMRAAGAVEDEDIRIGRLRRRIRLRYTGIPDADMGWGEVLADLDAARRDPLGRYFELERAHGDPDPEKRPVWLQTDKPWDDPETTRKEIDIFVRIPKPDPLLHDTAFFTAVARHAVHGGRLDGLADYYRR
jgi:cytosine/adenosine deaminase-related metal-dependent hydrolase